MGQFVPNMPGGFGSGYGTGFGTRNQMPGGGPGWMTDPQQSYEFGEQQRQQKALAGLQSQTSLAQAQIGADASTLPARLRQERFNTVWPFMSNQFSQAAQNLAGQGGSGAAGGGPGVTVGPVWNQQQIAQQQNQQRSQVDAATQSNQRQAAQRMAGQGYGANSPLSQALNAQYANQGLATNAQQSQAIAWNAAQGNATQQLNSQQANAQIYAQRQQEAIQREQVRASQYNALLAALGGMSA